MLKKEERISKIEIDMENRCISIARDEVVLENDEVISRKRHRQAFAPGDIDEVKKFIKNDEAEEVELIRSLWPKKVINAYKKAIEDSIG